VEGKDDCTEAKERVCEEWVTLGVLAVCEVFCQC